MLVVKDYIYFVTGNHEGQGDNGVEVWSSSDGENWSLKNLPGFGSADSKSSRSLAKCGKYLYVGVENRKTGAQLWRRELSAVGDLVSDWSLVEGSGFDNANNCFISELIVFNGKLYAGIINVLSGMELWSTETCDEVDPSNVVFIEVFTGGLPNSLGFAGSEASAPNSGEGLSGLAKVGGWPGLEGLNSNLTGFDSTGDSGVLTLKNVDDHALYLGTVNYVFGASLYVSFDGTNFIPIFLSGNGEDRLSYVSAMEVYNGRLYVGTWQRPKLKNLMEFGFEAFARVWTWTLFSLDPENPFNSLVEETTDAFGSCYQYGLRTMATYNGALMLGSAGANKIGGTLVFEAKARQ